MFARSCLSVPGNNLKMIEKAITTSADCIVYDLEDSVPASQKGRAREDVRTALDQYRTSGKYLVVRINSINTAYASEDILKIVETAPDALVIPKVNSAEDVKVVERILDDVENKFHLNKKVALQALIETAKGVQAVDEIATASKRLNALVFGMGDYFADIGAKNPRSIEELRAICLYPRSRIVIAATAAGIHPIDTMYPNFKDADGLRADAEIAVRMGFKGKWVIHPSQIDIVNETFSPTIDEIKLARKILAAYDRSKAEGIGATSIDGLLVDEASVQPAIKLMAVAKQCGLWDKI